MYLVWGMFEGIVNGLCRGVRAVQKIPQGFYRGMYKGFYIESFGKKIYIRFVVEVSVRCLYAFLLGCIVDVL